MLIYNCKEEEDKKMNKNTLQNTLSNYIDTIKKTTRKDIFKKVLNLTNTLKDDIIINDYSAINGGDLIELVERQRIHSKTHEFKKSSIAGMDDDIDHKQRVEIKFSTSDAYAHSLSETMALVRVIAYTKADGFQVYDIPNYKLVLVNNQGRPYANQLAKYVNKDLTKWYNDHSK